MKKTFDISINENKTPNVTALLPIMILVTQLICNNGKFIECTYRYVYCL